MPSRGDRAAAAGWHCGNHCSGSCHIVLYQSREDAKELFRGVGGLFHEGMDSLGDGVGSVAQGMEAAALRASHGLSEIGEAITGGAPAVLTIGVVLCSSVGLYQVYRLYS